ncbi:MAG: BACON domain-containing protein [Chloroflexia bacterium]
MRRLVPLLLMGFYLLGSYFALPASARLRPAAQPEALSFFGVNGYFTGYERPWSEVLALLPTGPAVGMRWTREEFSWANIEYHQGVFDFHIFDPRLQALAEAGYGIIGMLLTTPPWARKPSCAGSYWCPPRDPADFAHFASVVVERFDGDGIDDAPGSPRVAYWEIWNEPNHPATWPGTAGEYAALLCAAYPAIKGADPTAQVLVGGVYVFDGQSGGPPAYDGLAFLSQVLAAAPEAWDAFDILSIHPFMPDVAPDQPGLWEPVTMLSRLQHALDWVQVHSGGKPVWITEVGWSTCTAGQGDCTPALSKTEDQQANYLLRTHFFALAKGVAHLSTFQLEDKFDGAASQLWGGCAILRTDEEGYAPKKAYGAYGVMVTQLDGASYLGPGPLHELVWETDGPRTVLSPQTRFDYRFRAPEGGYLDILWRPDEAVEWVSFPVPDGWTVRWVERDGEAHTLMPSGGQVTFPIDGQPGYLRQIPPPELAVSTTELGFLAPVGAPPEERELQIWNAGGGTFSWTLSVLSGTEIFAAEPTQGFPPATVRVTATVPAAPGLYRGALSVDAGPAGSERIALWLLVVDRLWWTHLPLVLKERPAAFPPGGSSP